MATFMPGWQDVDWARTSPSRQPRSEVLADIAFPPRSQIWRTLAGLGPSSATSSSPLAVVALAAFALVAPLTAALASIIGAAIPSLGKQTATNEATIQNALAEGAVALARAPDAVRRRAHKYEIQFLDLDNDSMDIIVQSLDEDTRDRVCKTISHFARAVARVELKELGPVAALERAVVRGSPASVAELVQARGVDCNLLLAAGFNTGLQLAAKLGKVGVVRVLLRAPDININAVVSGGERRTALCLAAANGRTPIVQLLLAARAFMMEDPAGEWSLQKTVAFEPLQYAAIDDDSTVLECLLEAGYPVDARSVGDTTALHTACRRATKDAIRALLAHGADADAVDWLGRTPLLELCRAVMPYNSPANHKVECARLLVAAGANGEALLTLQRSAFSYLTPQEWQSVVATA